MATVANLVMHMGRVTLGPVENHAVFGVNFKAPVPGIFGLDVFTFAFNYAWHTGLYAFCLFVIGNIVFSVDDGIFVISHFGANLDDRAAFVHDVIGLFESFRFATMEVAFVVSLDNVVAHVYKLVAFKCRNYKFLVDVVFTVNIGGTCKSLDIFDVFAVPLDSFDGYGFLGCLDNHLYSFLLW